MSDNFFKSQKGDIKDGHKKLNSAQNLTECVICYDRKANCL